MDIQSILATIKDVVVIIVAIAGLTTWNRQLKGQASYELARQLLRKTYLFHDVIQESRRELASLLDYKEIKTLITDKGSDISYVFPLYLAELDRIETTSNSLLAELKTDFREAKVIWGIDLKELNGGFTDLLRIKFEQHYHVAALRLIYKDKQDNQVNGKSCKETLREIIDEYDRSTEDEFQEQLTMCVSQVESLLSEYLNRKPHKSIKNTLISHNRKKLRNT